MKLSVGILLSLSITDMFTGYPPVVAVGAERGDVVPYIVHGHHINPCDVPYILRLTIYKPHRMIAYCSGTLLDNYHVLTAAHCLVNKEKAYYVEVRVRTGKRRKTPATKRVKSSSWIIHRGYRHAYTLVNDLAILILDEPVQYGPCIRPVKLPSKSHRFSHNCTISGWGFTSAHSGLSSRLNTAHMRRRDGDTCERMAPIDRRYHICAGMERKGKANICKGDSGGPLLCKLPHKGEVLAGVSSFVFSCDNNFAVFTNVKTYTGWIEERMMDFWADSTHHYNNNNSNNNTLQHPSTTTTTTSEPTPPSTPSSPEEYDGYFDL